MPWGRGEQGQSEGVYRQGIDTVWGYIRAAIHKNDRTRVTSDKNDMSSLDRQRDYKCM